MRRYYQVLFYVFFITSISSISCSGSDVGTVTLSSSEGIWNTLKNSTDSTLSDSNIQDIITDLSSKESQLKMYTGSGEIQVLTLGEQDMGSDYSFVYMLGGLGIDGVSAEDYFNMMKLQANNDEKFQSDETFNETGKTNGYGYELDNGVTYNYKSSKSTDSKVKYEYHKDTVVANNNVDYYYHGIAYFIKISDNLYTVVNTLDEKDNSKNGELTDTEVTSLYSISIISGSSPVSVYLGMKQRANNHGSHAKSVNNMKEFFKEDAKRSYNNAKNYTRLKNK